MRLRNSILLAFIAILVVVTPILAAAYSAPYTITESSSTAYTMLPVSVNVDNQWLADNGFMTATALDTRIETLGGLERPHMVASDRTLTSVAVPADSQTNLYFTTGNSDLTATDIIEGYGGYLTIPDAAGLEIGDDFEIEIDGYVDTTGGADKNLVYKEDAFSTYVSAAGEITSAIELGGGFPQVEAVNGDFDDNAVLNHTVNLPAGIVAGELLVALFVTDGGASAVTWPNEGTDWIQLLETASGGIQLAAAYRIADGGEGASITVVTANALFSAYTTYRISGYSLVPEVGISATGTSANPDPPSLTPSWGARNTLWFAIEGNDDIKTVNAYPANYTDGRNDVGLNAGSSVGVGSARRELNAVSDDPGTFTLSAVEQWIANIIAIAPAPLTVTAVGVASGEHIIRTTADTTDLKIYVDAVEEDTIALGGASVPDNANDWFINQEDVLPYKDYYKHTVGGALVTRYEPNAIIINTGEAGTADAGTATTLDDAILTQANDYWNGAKLIIVTTTDTLAPQGENAVITDFDAANDRLTFAALTAVVDVGDTYTVDFGTLPDREVAGNDARITWGVNPTGVAVALGGMVSESQPVPGGIVVDETTDILPAIGVSDWYVEPDVGGTLLTNPLRPFVTLMSDSTTITELQAWRILALAFILGVTVSAIAMVRGHLLIAGIAGGAAIGLTVAWTIFPLWALIFMVLAVVGGLVAERSPSL